MRSLLGDRVPLRVTLVAAVLALMALALGVSAVLGTATLRSYLLDRVDGQLRGTARIVPNSDRPLGPPPGDQTGIDRPRASTAFFSQVTDVNGRAVRAASFATPDPKQTRPRLPTLTAAYIAAHLDRPFTVPATGAGHDWRVLLRRDSAGAVVTVATSLNDVDGTIDRTERTEVVVGLAVLLALGIVGYAVVRSSLRRLGRVETTAAAIAAGDLSRRVPESSPRTEVGRLAAAVNTMLATIETSFTARQASEDEARASEERMRRFVADASHELRTPLTSIRGYAELHRQGALDAPGVERALRRVEQEATRMGLLVDDLLLLARLDSQRPLERRPVDLLEIAGDAVQDAAAIAPGHPVRLEVRGLEAGGTGDGPPVVLGDEARLRQVVANLMSNAYTHTPAGTPVTVSLGTSGEQVVLEVADAGPGLAPEDAARVFERFYRSDPARTRAAGGSGLGLSIVAALVAAHGGTMEVESAPGEGALFRLRLPVYAPGTRPARSVEVSAPR